MMGVDEQDDGKLVRVEFPDGAVLYVPEVK